MNRIRLFLREIEDFWKFLQEGKQSREIIFYSEKAIYYQYFGRLIKEILNNSNLEISYITSDPEDPTFNLADERFNVYYISKLLPFFILSLDSKVIIMTMPDLNQFHIRRSLRGGHHIYIFHSVVSTHMSYRKGAFDFYDTLLCVGPHHIQEIRKTEELYHLPAKNLLSIGYHWLDQLYDEYQVYLKNKNDPPNGEKCILIAPTWALHNILETCIELLISSLTQKGYKIVIRPHPEFLKKNPEKISRLLSQFKEFSDVELDTMLHLNRYVHEAEVLITDWSGIALEYAFGTERPVLFVNTPPNVYNPEYEKLQIEPLEITLRDKIGQSLQIEEISKVDLVIKDLIHNRSQYQKEIIKYRQETIFNFRESSKVGAWHVIDLCKVYCTVALGNKTVEH